MFLQNNETNIVYETKETYFPFACINTMTFIKWSENIKLPAGHKQIFTGQTLYNNYKILLQFRQLSAYDAIQVKLN